MKDVIMSSEGTLEVYGDWQPEEVKQIIYTRRGCLKGVVFHPKKETAHWVYDPDGMDWGLPAWKCSKCNGRNSMIPTHLIFKGKARQIENPTSWAGSKFCPNCGSEMVEAL